MTLPPTRLAAASKLLALAVPILGLAAPPEAALAQASFACRAPAADRCHFAVLHRDGRRTEFVLRHGATRTIDDAAVAADRYMVAADHAPPADPSRCSRAPVVGAKPPRSQWCRLSTVRPGRND